MVGLQLGFPRRSSLSSSRPQRSSSLAEFAAEPIGHYLASATWLNLCARHDLSIQLIWGRPTDADIEALFASMRELPRTEPQAVLFDCSQLDDTTLGDALRRRQLLETRRELTSGGATRHALVCPSQATALFVESFGANSSNQLFRDFDAALDWLAPTLTPEERAGIRAVRTGATATHSLLARLRQLFLREDVTKIDVAFAARQLGSSRRSLQRALAQQGTSFRAELLQSRLQRAKRELTTGASVTWLAYELGFQNVQSFIRVFKQGTGITPGAWRRGESALRRATSGDASESRVMQGEGLDALAPPDVHRVSQRKILEAHGLWRSIRAM